MTVAFEDLVDDLRGGDLNETGRRRLSMVLRSQDGAVMDLALLDLFDEPRELRDEDYDVADLVDGTLAQLESERPSDASEIIATEARHPFDPLPLPPKLPSPPTLRSSERVAATRAALGRPFMSSPLTTTQKLAVQLAHRPFRPPWLAAAVVLLSLGMGWTARGLFVDPAPDAVVPARKAVVPSPEPEARALGADDLLAFAENAVARAHHPRAERLYQELLRRFPHSPEAPMARLGLARLQLEVLDEPATAAASYGAFLAAHPHDDLAPDAALGRARALEAAGSAEAAAAWRAIEERFPESDAAAIGRTRGR